MLSKRGTATILALALTSTVTTLAHGEGFRIPYQGASAAGQGNAFAAQADDPSAVFYNPAGLTQVRRVQVYAGTSLVGGHVSFTSPTNTTVRGDLAGSIAVPTKQFLHKRQFERYGR